MVSGVQQRFHSVQMISHQILLRHRSIESFAEENTKTFDPRRDGNCESLPGQTASARESVCTNRPKYAGQMLHVDSINMKGEPRTRGASG